MGLLEQIANWKFYLMGTYPVGELGGLLLNIVLAILSLLLGFLAACILRLR